MIETNKRTARLPPPWRSTDGSSAVASSAFINGLVAKLCAGRLEKRYLAIRLAGWEAPSWPPGDRSPFANARFGNHSLSLSTVNQAEGRAPRGAVLVDARLIDDHKVP